MIPITHDMEYGVPAIMVINDLFNTRVRNLYSDDIPLSSLNQKIYIPVTYEIMKSTDVSLHQLSLPFL